MFWMNHASHACPLYLHDNHLSQVTIQTRFNNSPQHHKTAPVRLPQSVAQRCHFQIYHPTVAILIQGVVSAQYLQCICGRVPQQSPETCSQSKFQKCASGVKAHRRQNGYSIHRRAQLQELGAANNLTGICHQEKKTGHLLVHRGIVWEWSVRRIPISLWCHFVFCRRWSWRPQGALGIPIDHLFLICPLN